MRYNVTDDEPGLNVDCVAGVGQREDIPAPGPPSTNITVTFSFSNMGFLVPPPEVAAALSSWRTSAIFSTTLGAIEVITILIRRVNGPDERVVV